MRVAMWLWRGRRTLTVCLAEEMWNNMGEDERLGDGD